MGRKVDGIWRSIFIYWFYNKMWVGCESGMYDPLTKYGKSEMKHLLADGRKMENETFNGRRM